MCICFFFLQESVQLSMSLLKSPGGSCVRRPVCFPNYRSLRVAMLSVSCTRPARPSRLDRTSHLPLCQSLLLSVPACRYLHVGGRLVCVDVYLFVSVGVCVFEFVCVCVCVFEFIFMCVCVCVRACVCVSVCMLSFILFKTQYNAPLN